MANTIELKQQIAQGEYDAAFTKLYGASAVQEQRKRYTDLIDEFEKKYGTSRTVRLYSAPGRTEIGGNHTDHNNGVVLAGSVNLDMVAVVSPNEDNIIRVKSLGFDKIDDVDVNLLVPQPQEAEHSASLIRGVAKGIVDAGGKGWVVALEAMLSALQGEDVVLPEDGAVTETKQSADFSDFNTEDITFSYCTEFIISRENDHDPENLRAFLSELGDSLVLVDDDEIIKVHVHTNDPGKALTEALNYGSFVTVKIENMRLQHTEKVLSEQEVAPKIAKPEKPLGVVSVCAGAGLADVFQNLGVDQIISGGQTMNPSTQAILQEVNRTPSQVVFVLPNNKNIIMAAQQVDALTPKTVVVIPSKTVPQGITAMLSFAPEGSVEENTAALTEALDTVDTMQITYAARNSDFDGYNIHEGDYLALYGSQLFGTSQDIRVLLKSLAEKVRDDGKEYITIYYGEDVKEKHAQKAADIFADICPNADVNLLSGGQPVYYYLISAE